MNIVCIPFHDWRKIEEEGSRTRDSHLINHFRNNKKVKKVLIVNRPSSYPELVVHKKKIKIEGEVILSKGNLKLYKISDKTFVLDYITYDIFSPILEKRLWIFKSFGYNKFIQFYLECIDFLNIVDYNVFTNNIFSINFVKKIKSNNIIFDAYDNLIFFPHIAPIKKEVLQSYNDFKDVCKFWTTNSKKNVNYYKEHYGQENCFLVKNGVDIEVFQKKYNTPQDMLSIKKPIIGFGGKITHLFDYNLFNYCIENNPDKNFVIVGQILNKEVFNKIKKTSNLFYLGDKKYTQYLSYVTNFDVGIIPYVTNDLESGVDSIKVYEYIAAGLNAVGTKGGGMPDISDYLFISNNEVEFSENLDKAINSKRDINLPEYHTWSSKSDEIIRLMNINC